VDRQSSSSTSSVLSTSSPRHTASPTAPSLGAAGPSAGTETAAPGGRRFDLLALHEAMSLATASSLRHAAAPPVNDLLHYGPALRGLGAGSSAACSSRMPAWIYPPSTGARYDLPGHDVKTHGFAPRPMREGTLKPNSIALSWSQTGPKVVADLLARASSLLAS